MDVGFGEGFAEGLETEMLVEGDGRDLCVQLQGSGSLALGLGDKLLHEESSEAFAAVGCEHSADT